ncbi:hypothetical protein AKJ16_DCAP14438 [Drosera capensis]
MRSADLRGKFDKSLGIPQFPSIFILTGLFIKLIRTDTTLDLSQKAEKVIYIRRGWRSKGCRERDEYNGKLKLLLSSLSTS